jgi:hypothetical protein
VPLRILVLRGFLSSAVQPQAAVVSIPYELQWIFGEQSGITWNTMCTVPLRILVLRGFLSSAVQPQAAVVFNPYELQWIFGEQSGFTWHTMCTLPLLMRVLRGFLLPADVHPRAAILCKYNLNRNASTIGSFILNTYIVLEYIYRHTSVFTADECVFYDVKTVDQIKCVTSGDVRGIV